MKLSKKELVELATTLSLTTTYAGEFAAPYIRGVLAALTTAGLITVKENVNWKMVVKKLVDPITFVAPTCDGDPTGTITITERILTLEWFEVVRMLCKQDFFADWQVGDMGPGLENLPKDLENAVMDNMIDGIAANLERVIWQGVNATVGEFDGFLTLMLADATVIDVPTAVALTAGNIIEKIALVISTSMASTKGVALHGATDKPELFLNSVTAMLYKQAQSALGNGTYYQQKDVMLEYLGYKMNVVPGIPNNVMVLAQPSNLWLGTTTMNQANNVGIYDLGIIGQKNVKFVANFAFGVQYGFGDEITLYHYPGNS